MTEENEVLRRVVEALHGLEMRYALVGSLATTRYGEPRATLDADIVADLREQDIARIVQELPASEFYLSEEAAREAVAVKGQFNLIHMATAFKIDFFLPSDGKASRALSGSRMMELLPGLQAYVAPPEELILKKLEYHRMGGSDKHLRDIAAMLQISPEEIDREYITREAEKLGVDDLWTAVVRRVDEA